MTSRTKKIAMIGMYGGYYRGEYNPGCIMICLKTYHELKKRIEDSEIDIYSIDNLAEDDQIYREWKDGLYINFFPAKAGVSLLSSLFSTYDAIVIGGDVIWDVFYEESGIFFIDSEPFLATAKPLVLFNCVHRFNPVEHQRQLFMNLDQRSEYIAVRTPFLKDQLARIGAGKVKVVPDPVLDLELKKIDKKTGTRPLIGISIRAGLCDSFIELLKNVDLSGFDVCFYPYSRQYQNHLTVMAIRDLFGDRFSYVMDYKDPLETFELIAGFDISVTDTYHGTIAALIQDVPFISIDFERPDSSRFTHLLKPFELDKRFVSVYQEPDESDAETFSRCLREFRALINDPPRVRPAQLKEVKGRIQHHFDEMAGIIMAGQSN